MTLEQQVTSLELSQKLKNLRAKQESLFYWVPVDIDSPEWIVILKKSVFQGRFYSAFTVAELGEMICSTQKYDLCVEKKDSKGKRWSLWIDDLVHETFYADTEVNVRAKCLIYLLENKLI